jgi:nodulation protein E
MGVVSALGHSVEEFWTSLREGRCGIGPIRNFDASALSVRVAAEVRDFDAGAHFDRSRLGLLDRFSQLGVVAARQAVAQSGIDFGELRRTSAVILGTGVGGEISLEQGYERLFLEKSTRVHPFTIPRMMLNAAVSHVTIEHGIQGPAYAVASACASASHAIGIALDMVRRGVVTAAITGGTEGCISLGTMRAWEGLRVMAPDTCRPFSRGRRGMVIGEGAGVLVIESLAHARRRGAPVVCELVGFGMSSDAESVVQTSMEGASRAMASALEDASLPPEAVGYINAHGTGTPANDVTETRAIRKVFGSHADRLAVSSTKSMHGHPMGAAGAIELVATICALNHGTLPPTINFLEPDPECDLDYVPNHARACQVDVALSNSFAFGGLNAVLAIRRGPA